VALVLGSIARCGKTTILVLTLFTTLSTLGQSRYGLSCYGDVCSGIDQKAERRMVTARTICGSSDTSILYRKQNKPTVDEASLYWRDIHSAERIAQSTYVEVTDCSKADLVIRISLDTLNDIVSLLVTDGDSGESVFSETRSIQDKRSDLVHAAQHFRDAVKNARLAAEAEQARLAEEYRQRQEAAATEREKQRCEAEFDSLKQSILKYVDKNVDPLQDLQDQIAAHNSECLNPISEEAVKNQRIAELKGRAVQEEAAKEQVAREKRSAELEKEKAAALADWTKRVVSLPFVPPMEGWTHESSLGTARWYIILPKTGLAPNCRFANNGSHPVLDCLGSEGRNDYVSVQNDGRWYLLKGKHINGGTGDHASTVKDGGTTLCLRQAGCYHVLAELRPEPTELPDKLHVPVPAALNAHYSFGEVAFGYPENWKLEERKNKDNTVTQVNIAPADAHLANWVTHGLFLGHVVKIADKFPQTLDGAYDQFSTYERLNGLTITDVRMQMVGDSQGKLGIYKGPSVFFAGESGWLAVVKDKTEGYYYLLMFYPSNDDATLYANTFSKILETFKFKK
jgi:hypothetical protein